MRQLHFEPVFPEWQRQARNALRRGWKPEEIMWEETGSDQSSLALGDPSRDTEEGPTFAVPREFVAVARRVACHSDPKRWTLLYRVLWRLTHGEAHLLRISVDKDIHRLMEMEKEIKRDVHKMRAFVRFRRIEQSEREWFVAWFEPSHRIVKMNAPFFVDRFASMSWSILTPDACAHWDGRELKFTPGVDRSQAPTEDVTEALWLKYYASIFNPARVKEQAMLSEMPAKYWKNLPEAAIIDQLLREAPGRVDLMMKKSQAETPSFPSLVEVEKPTSAGLPKSLPELRDAASRCTACPLYQKATQTVFGEGSPHASVVFVGEQPGDNEDLAGKPFIGPAGRLFDRALMEAQIDRSGVYVTNAVKHFKWEPAGKRRLHKKPSLREVAACRPWLVAEMEVLRPKFLVCLGSTAAQSVFERPVKVLQERGRFYESPFSSKTFITVHPSSLLRTIDPEAQARDYAQFVDDLKKVKNEFA